jgi:hypothetical protein
MTLPFNTYRPSEKVTHLPLWMAAEACKHYALPLRTNFMREHEEKLNRRARLTEAGSAVKRPTAATEKARFFLQMRSGGGFGNGSPQWTIPSGRRSPPPADPTPDPGRYDIPFVGIDSSRRTAIRHHDEPRWKPGPDEYLIRRQFPEIRPKHIASIHENERFFMPLPDSPAPTYVPQDGPGRKCSSIGVKRPRPDATAVPGPGQYNPENPSIIKTPAYSLVGVNRKCYTESELNDNPGPGAYDIGPQLSRPPKWTNKARERSSRFRALWQSRDRPWSQMSNSES